ncbi:hypothetical protein CSIRO_1215 [Bradyrhizobiaceae bacterium SG-6C]|nr:hypothetical protein CSIRO_1215 [Bradyrhizobiaceae bacterium SG-6C]
MQRSGHDRFIGPTVPASQALSLQGSNVQGCDMTTFVIGVAGR